LKTLNTIDLPWTVANASTLNAGAWRWFSATCYLFGQQLHERYPGVPIGLVSSAFGGTQIEYWMGPDPIADCKNVTQTPSETSILWNSMVVPFLDMRLKGTSRSSLTQAPTPTR
jgi:sialate O-acetylesterase